jgi:hypothetical protein
MVRSRTSTGARPRITRYARNPGGSFDPLNAIAWHSAFWAEDPDWSAPADGGAVSDWRNAGSVGTDYNAVQATASKQPTYRAATAAYNNRPTVQFDATDDFLRTAAWTATTQPLHLVVIANLGATTATRSIVDGRDAYRGLVTGFSSARWGMNWGTPVNEAVGTSTTNPSLIVQLANGASSTMDVNGTQVIATDAGVLDSIGLTLGANNIGTGSFGGHLAFVGLYDGTLSAADLAALEAWATSHYGITVA